MELDKHPGVKKAFSAYPKPVREKLLRLRELILDTASATAGVNRLVETLKWGEPSYIANKGSTIRLGVTKEPGQYAMYFICTTSLVDTFRLLHGDKLRFESNRAILFRRSDRIPVRVLKQCIALALTYHRVKHLPLLGA